MIIKKYSIFSLLVFLPLFINAQEKDKDKVNEKDIIKVFVTYNDYLKDIGITYDRIIGVKYFGDVKLYCKKDGKRTVYSGKKIWGYKKNEDLYRTVNKKSPQKIISTGKFIIYGDSLYFCNISESLDTEIIDIPTLVVHSTGNIVYPGYSSPAGKIPINRFKRKNPQFYQLYQCIDKEFNCEQIILCNDKLSPK